jgi:endogenous inhibitor of DNA gyrase (YacG/DUF329 family)
MNPIIKRLNAIKAQAQKIANLAETLKDESDLEHVWNCLDTEEGELAFLISWLEDEAQENSEKLETSRTSDNTLELECTRCGKVVDAKITWQPFSVKSAGGHLRADCPECGKFIKFISQHRMFVGNPMAKFKTYKERGNSGVKGTA